MRDCSLEEGEVGFVVDKCLENTKGSGSTNVGHVLGRTDIPVGAAVLSLGFRIRRSFPVWKSFRGYVVQIGGVDSWDRYSSRRTMLSVWLLELWFGS